MQPAALRSDLLMPQTLREAWFRAHHSQLEEVDVPLSIVEGALPEGLRGSLLRAGQGRMARGGKRYAHPFDGDGMVARFSFSDKGIRYRNRHVRTREFCAEEAAGRMLFRGFGTNLPGGIGANALRTVFRNCANTNIVSHAGKLLVLWEGGLPHTLDPDTLETLERYDFEGQLLEPLSLRGRLLGRELPFSAHPRLDLVTGDLYNFGTLMGPRPKLLLYRVDPAGRMDSPRRIDLKHLSLVHDFVLTPHYYVFLIPSVAFGTLKMVLGLNSPVGSMASAPGASETVLLVPRDGGAPLQIPAPPGFFFHFANGYEDDAGNIVLDGARWQAFPVMSDLSREVDALVYRGEPPRLTRFTINPQTGSVQAKLLSTYGLEFPSADPRMASVPHRYLWGAGAAPSWEQPGSCAILKVDTVTGETLKHDLAPDLPGEPLMVPRPGSSREGDGWLLVTVYVAALHRTELLVLDAQRLTLLCRARLPHHLPIGFHGTWIQAHA